MFLSSRFPNDPEKRDVAKKFTKNEWQPSKHSKMCSDHFKESDINRACQRVRLRENAIPT